MYRFCYAATARRHVPGMGQRFAQSLSRLLVARRQLPHNQFMPSPFAPYHRGILDLCRRHGVRRLDVFGSAAGPDFDSKRSDADFLVEFADPGPEGASDRYFGLHEGLESILGRHVDLIVRGAIRNPYFLLAAQQQSVNLYAA